MDDVKKANLGGIFLVIAGILGIYRSVFYHFPNGGLEILLGIAYLVLGSTFLAIGGRILYHNKKVTKVESVLEVL